MLNKIIINSYVTLVLRELIWQLRTTLLSKDFAIGAILLHVAAPTFWHVLTSQYHPPKAWMHIWFWILSHLEIDTCSFASLPKRSLVLWYGKVSSSSVISSLIWRQFNFLIGNPHYLNNNYEILFSYAKVFIEKH